MFPKPQRSKGASEKEKDWSGSEYARLPRNLLSLPSLRAKIVIAEFWGGGE